MSAALQFLPASVEAAKPLVARLGLPVDAIALHHFPDQELRVTVAPPMPTTLIFASLDRPNEKLLALLFAAEALLRMGAKRLVLVAPCLCYMRQNKAFHQGEAISQKVVGPLLAQSFDRVVTVDAHLHRTKDIGDIFPGIAPDKFSAMPTIEEALRLSGFDSKTVVVGPNAESRPLVADLADRLGLDFAVAQKTRCGDRSVVLAFADSALFAGRPALMVDDIVSSGGTLIAATKALHAAGASTVDAIVTHALFAPEFMRALFEAGIRSLKSSDSVPHPTNAIPLDGILAAALRQEIAA